MQTGGVFVGRCVCMLCVCVYGRKYIADNLTTNPAFLNIIVHVKLITGKMTGDKEITCNYIFGVGILYLHCFEQGCCNQKKKKTYYHFYIQ